MRTLHAVFVLIVASLLAANPREALAGPYLGGYLDITIGVEYFDFATSDGAQFSAEGNATRIDATHFRMQINADESTGTSTHGFAALGSGIRITGPSGAVGIFGDPGAASASLFDSGRAVYSFFRGIDPRCRALQLGVDLQTYSPGRMSLARNGKPSINDMEALIDCHVADDFPIGGGGPTSPFDMISYAINEGHFDFFRFAVVTPLAVPEPATWALLAMPAAIAGLAARRRRRA